MGKKATRLILMGARMVRNDGIVAKASVAATNSISIHFHCYDDCYGLFKGRREDVQ